MRTYLGLNLGRRDEGKQLGFGLVQRGARNVGHDNSSTLLGEEDAGLQANATVKSLKLAYRIP